MSPTTVIPISSLDNAPSHEETYVHAVYEEIASHFSSTRYKPWPIISAFLGSIPAGWVGLDAGTGNGKYLDLVLPRAWLIGLDRSANLLSYARGTADMPPREVVRGDVLANAWRVGVFDFAISIATIHHLATHERRCRAVQSLLESVSPTHGRVLIYVWAIEQDSLSKRTIPVAAAVENTNSLNTTTEMSTRVPKRGQDVFVPWVTTSSTQAKTRPKNSKNPDDAAQDNPHIFNRYYHMFAKEELLDLVTEAAEALNIHIGPIPTIAHTQPSRGMEVIQNGWERSNYYVELKLWYN